MAIFGALRAIMGGKDKSEDRALRPRTFEEYGGQEDVVEALRVSVVAARGQGKPLDHLLVTGGAGLGKTTLAEVVANELGVALRQLMGPMVKAEDELVQALVHGPKNGVLFIDEIHALPLKLQEVLYTAMEDYTVTVGGHKIRIQPFTLIGATTSMGRLSKPLKDRFGIKAALRPYGVDKMAGIVMAGAAKSGVPCTPEAAAEIARRSQRTPRVALAILRRVMDCAYDPVTGRTGAVTHEVALRGCRLAGYDRAGLNGLARQYLRALADRGAPVALGTLSSVLGEAKDVIEDEVEPYLLSIGFVEKTPKGRLVTAEGRRHLLEAVS